MKRDDWLVVGMRLFGVYFFVKGLLAGVSTLLAFMMIEPQTREFTLGFGGTIAHTQNLAAASAIVLALLTALIGAALFYGAPHILEWQPLQRKKSARRRARPHAAGTPTPEV